MACLWKALSGVGAWELLRPSANLGLWPWVLRGAFCLVGRGNAGRRGILATWPVYCQAFEKLCFGLGCGNCLDPLQIWASGRGFSGELSVWSGAKTLAGVVSGRHRLSIALPSKSSTRGSGVGMA